jgi:hypothetical protein
MRIHNPKTGQWVETRCTGCPCHWHSAIVMGDGLDDGCCRECGCPRSEAGWAYYVKEHPDRVRGHEPELGGDTPRPGDAPALE